MASWLNTNVNPVGSAVTVDESLTISGSAADSKVVGDNITDLKNVLKPSSMTKLGFELGTLNNGEATTSTTRCRTIDYIPVRQGDVILMDASYDMSVTEYDLDYTFISVSGWLPAKTYVVSSGNYVKIVARKNSSNPTLTDTDVSAVNSGVYVFNIGRRVTILEDVADGIRDIVIQADLRSQMLVGWYHDGHGSYKYNVTFHRNTIIHPVYATYNTTIYTDNSHDIALQYFDGFETGASHLVSTTAWGKSFVVPAGTYFCLTFRNSDNSETNENTNNYLYAYSAKPINEEVLLNRELANAALAELDGENYAISPDLKRRGVKTEFVGMLTYLQSFCIYDGNYFSTNGSNISKQDSTFTETDNATLAVGHGNSMQVGTAHPNYAYISGWNDQKVYVVDLDTLTLVNTITLPTTGYTTVAVDDVNGLAYIFQRNTYPSTEERYNFIVYDYVNDNVISTKKTLRAFAAMQSVEFYEGKIYVLNGLGTSAAPNYYLIYNTIGDVIGEYIFGDFSTTEPEGVCIDRTTKELYVSTVRRSLYKIAS